MTAPDAIVAAAYQADAGLAPLLLAIAQFESGFDPNAVGDDGTSFGLTQLHWGGLGTGYDAATLLDPLRNFRIAAAAIRDRLARNGGDLYDGIQPWSTRPQAWALYQSGAFAGGPAPNVGAAVTAGPSGLFVPALVVVGLALVLLR